MVNSYEPVSQNEGSPNFLWAHVLTGLANAQGTTAEGSVGCTVQTGLRVRTTDESLISVSEQQAFYPRLSATFISSVSFWT